MEMVLTERCDAAVKSLCRPQVDDMSGGMSMGVDAEDIATVA